MSATESESAAFYERTAEYVAVLMGGAWNGLGPALTAVLDGLDVTEGPIVDVGAGTGLGTRVIAAALPDAEIVAVEPNRALRTALLAVIASDPDLRQRVTVLDSHLLAAELPARISGMTAMNVIGHFSPADRTLIWALLAERLTSNGRAVTNLYPPHQPATVPETAMAHATVGRRHYWGSASAEPVGTDAVTWSMTYRVEQDGALVDGFTVADHWYVFTPEQLAEEVAVHGLHLTTGDEIQGIQVITRV